MKEILFIFLFFLCFFSNHRAETCVQNSNCKQHHPNEAFQLIFQDSEGYLHLNEECANYVNNIASKIGVVSVIGPYRSGKSYLLNQLINNQIFGVSSTVQPCTKGIWFYIDRSDHNQFYDQHVSPDHPEVVLFSDTIGLFSPQSREESDARIVALTSLISSILIYNHLNVVESRDIERFNFLVQYARGIPPHNIIDDWKSFQSDLIWIVRDFHLKITNTKNESVAESVWFNETLSQIPNGKHIYSLFNKIKIFTLPSPSHHNNEKELQSLQFHPEYQTNEFKQSLAEVRSQIFQTLRNKKIFNDMPMNGSVLIDLIKTIIDRLNGDSGVHSINTINSLVSAINHQLLQNLLQEYVNSMSKASSPMKGSQLKSIHYEVVNAILNSLQNRLYLSENTQLEENKNLLLSNIEREFTILTLNNKQSINDRIESAFNEIVAKFEKNFLDDVQLMSVEEISDYASKKIKSATDEYKQYISHYHDSGEEHNEEFESKIFQLGIHMDSITREKIVQNQNISFERCEGTLSILQKDIIERVANYKSLQRFENDFLNAELNFNSTCKGPGIAIYSKLLKFKEDALKIVKSNIIKKEIQYQNIFCILFLVSVFCFIINCYSTRATFLLYIPLTFFLIWCILVCFDPIVFNMNFDKYIQSFALVANLIMWLLQIIGIILTKIGIQMMKVLNFVFDNGGYILWNLIIYAYKKFDELCYNISKIIGVANTIMLGTTIFVAICGYCLLKRQTSHTITTVHKI